MQVLNVVDSGTDLEFRWPLEVERYDHWVEYSVKLRDRLHTFRLGFGTRPAYGLDRKRAVVWIGGEPHAEFFGAGDFGATGDMVCELKVLGDRALRMCRYPDEQVPAEYASFRVDGMPNRVTGPYVRGAWAIIANIADHETMCAVAALRRGERQRKR